MRIHSKLGGIRCQRKEIHVLALIFTPFEWHILLTYFVTECPTRLLQHLKQGYIVNASFSSISTLAGFGSPLPIFPYPPLLVCTELFSIQIKYFKHFF
mmetsp:Transcript_9678/g.17020  ORF Transcript_9678/g.17020 Transcript_9678/m.17020 type:complete len:98 (+) Transcript_9678:916-1209(+)